MRSIIWLMTLSFLFIWKTHVDMRPFPETLSLADSRVKKVQIVDRNSIPLTVTYQNEWNLHEYIALHEIPEILQKIFILSEDKRFFEHNGIDWTARFSALFQNVRAGHIVRGASTVTEQVVRMLHPRRRTFWARWLEGYEAEKLEKRFSKTDILEFYLNQIPYANQRRGIVQAAYYYFNRNIDTLNLKEMLALAVMVRAPSLLNLHKNPQVIESSIIQLAKRLLDKKIIDNSDYQTVVNSPLSLQYSGLDVQATHFVNYVASTQTQFQQPNSRRLFTTLDAHIQNTVQNILDNQIYNMAHKNVHNGAVLIVEHENNEILAWVNAGNLSPDISGSQIDAVTTPRQPGSTLKPFLYALALEKGWTAATLINDEPLAEAVGTGIHDFHNYSRNHYGLLRLRDALGNSLNIPAIHTIQFVGVDIFLQRLHQLGIKSLTGQADFYGDGLALGNGELTLFELVQAYSALANQGRFKPLTVLQNSSIHPKTQIFSTEVASLIANILSDSDARRLEFGRGHLLRFPVQTAVKTGTSTDYRDAWAIGFNSRYTVGVWLGNLDRQSMSEISGATIPSLILRAIFAELNRYQEGQALYLSPQLISVDICRKTGKRADSDCPSRNEWFIEDTEPPLHPLVEANSTQITHEKSAFYLRQPIENLQLATDPRIPDEQEAFPLIVSPIDKQGKIEWLIDGEIVATTTQETAQFLWQIQRGTHTAQARFKSAQELEILETPEVTFYVK